MEIQKLMSSTLLLGKRVRYVDRGEPFYGIIVHCDSIASSLADAILVLPDGTMVAKRIVKLQLVAEDIPKAEPYR